MGRTDRRASDDQEGAAQEAGSRAPITVGPRRPLLVAASHRPVLPIGLRRRGGERPRCCAANPPAVRILSEPNPLYSLNTAPVSASRTRRRTDPCDTVWVPSHGKAQRPCVLGAAGCGEAG